MFIDGVGLFFYLLAIVYASKFGLNVTVASWFVGIAPIIFNAAYRLLIATAYHKPLMEIFSLADIITAILQLMLAFVIFTLLDRNEDSLGSWVLITIIGVVVSYTFVPSTMPLITAFVS